MINSYKDLIIWQKSMKLAKEIYGVTEKMPKSEQFGLVSQIRRAAVSVPSNIAEGNARKHTKEFIQFLRIAFGSLAELETQLLLANDLQFIHTTQLNGILDDINELQKMTMGLLKKLVEKP